MKTLNSPPKFLAYAVIRAVKHPRTPITYHYCSDCKLRYNSRDPECPQCHKKIGESPENKKESPIPWYGSVALILVGAAIWGWSAACGVSGISELGRVLVYMPLGNLFGMSLQK